MNSLVDETGFRVPLGYYRAEGMIKNVNTIEEYKNVDKRQMLEQSGKMVRRCHVIKLSFGLIGYLDMGCN